MITKELEVINRAGIHARPASQIVTLANKYKSDIFFSKGSMKINAKSIMGIITLGATYKTKLTVSVEGEDEEALLNAMEGLFNNRFED